MRVGYSQRQLQVGEEIRRGLATLFSRSMLRDPELVDRTLLVTEVRPSADFENATVFIIPQGGEQGEGRRRLLKVLGQAAPFLRRALAKVIYLRYTPRLLFRYDDSFEQADRIDALLRRPGVEKDLHTAGEHLIPSGARARLVHFPGVG